MAMTEAVKEPIWLQGLLGELGISQKFVTMHSDNQSEIHLAKNQVYHARTKHIDVRYHFIREILEEGWFEDFTKMVDGDTEEWIFAKVEICKNNMAHMWITLQVAKDADYIRMDLPGIPCSPSFNDSHDHEEMRRLEAMGTYTDGEINRLAGGGKQRGHITGVGRVLPARATAIPSKPVHESTLNSLHKKVDFMMSLFKSDSKYSDMFSQLESGGASESGRCEDEEEGADYQDDDDEDGDGDT
nr:retrovirus-related Pol polyprotein from transposon TNT 1-94 [Tanacetum cinerariifolium]